MLYANVQKSLSLYPKKISNFSMIFLLFVDNETVNSLFFASTFCLDGAPRKNFLRTRKKV